jgi:hypothetical protein
MGPEGRAFSLAKDARCEECDGILRYSKHGDAYCEDYGLISEYPGVDESKYRYYGGPSEIDYEPLSNFLLGAGAKSIVEASSIPEVDLATEILFSKQKVSVSYVMDPWSSDRYLLFHFQISIDPRGFSLFGMLRPITCR